MILEEYISQFGTEQMQLAVERSRERDFIWGTSLFGEYRDRCCANCGSLFVYEPAFTKGLWTCSCCRKGLDPLPRDELTIVVEGIDRAIQAMQLMTE